MNLDLAGKAVKSLRLSTVNYNNTSTSVIPAQAGDVNSRYLSVVLYDERGNIPLNEYSAVRLNATLPDGTPQFSDGKIDQEKNAAILKISGSMLTQIGKVACNARLTGVDSEGNDICLTSSAFYILVHKTNADDSALEGTDNYSLLQQLSIETKQTKTETATVKKQVTKNAQDIALLKEVSEGTLYTVDENFPSYDSAGTMLLYPPENYYDTAFVTEIVVNNPQPNASYIGVECWTYGLIGLVEVPDYIRELLTYPKITDATLGTTSTYSLDLENKIRKQTYQTVNFEEYCDAFEYEEITDDSLLPKHVVATLLNSSLGVNYDDLLSFNHIFRIKEKISGAYVLDDPSIVQIYDDDMGDVYGICGGYYISGCELDDLNFWGDFDFGAVDNLTIYKPIEVASAPIEMKLDIDMLRDTEWVSGEFYNGISDENPRNYDFSDLMLLDQAGTHDNVPIIKAYVKL